MTEAELRKVVERAFKPSKAHLSWIEAPMSCPGFPDLELSIKGICGQIELKVTDSRGRIKIRRTQYRWFKDRVASGGKPFMWIEHEGMHYLVPGMFVDGLNHISQLNNATVIYEDPLHIANYVAWSMGL